MTLTDEQDQEDIIDSLGIRFLAMQTNVTETKQRCKSLLRPMKTDGKRETFGFSTESW